jgi:hypothetical protein
VFPDQLLISTISLEGEVVHSYAKNHTDYCPLFPFHLHPTLLIHTLHQDNANNETSIWTSQATSIIIGVD